METSSQADEWESAGLGFYLDAKSNPRLRYRCLLRHTADYEKAQSIACSEEWRLLVPISRLTRYYHAVRKSHEHFERVFRHWRDRYGVAGKNADTRLKRPGLPFQQLRASALWRSSGSVSASATDGWVQRAGATSEGCARSMGRSVCARYSRRGRCAGWRCRTDLPQ